MKIAVRESRDLAEQRVVSALTVEGHSVTAFGSHEAFVHEIERKSYALAIIGGDDVEDSARLVHLLRSAPGGAIPVLRLIDEATEQHIADALNGGADDCMAAPARKLELLARVSALARRGKPPVTRERDRLEIGALVIDRKNRLIYRDRQPVPMTPKTYNLAVLLLTNVGQLLARGEMLQSVWGVGKKGSTRTLDTHISRLRLALGLVPENGWQLQSVYQHGYRLDCLEAMDTTQVQAVA